jgi:D-glycero-D-manno-heptose 1,7-bisphosphate phosphatase
VPEGLSPALFIDRDGTLMKDVDYCSDPRQVEVFKGAPEALKKLRERGYKLIIITNQSGIGRGHFDERAYRAVEQEVDRQIGHGVIDGSYFCPHAPDEECTCRKPEPGMVLQAAKEHGIDLARSFFIGDKASDLQCGRRAGTKTILVQTGYGKQADQSAADIVVADLPSAVEQILEARDDTRGADAAARRPCQ